MQVATPDVTGKASQPVIIDWPSLNVTVPPFGAGDTVAGDLAVTVPEMAPVATAPAVRVPKDEVIKVAKRSLKAAADADVAALEEAMRDVTGAPIA